MMDLQLLWFILIALLLTGFFFLEGFDFGVGMLLPLVGTNDGERRMILSSIGPFWDGNEVWLIASGAAVFAAFPNWYATLLSGFYAQFFLLLGALIVRGAAIEFRSQRESPLWRSFWDWMIFAGSVLPGFLWGVIIASLLQGVPIDAHLNYVGTLLSPFKPFALLMGLAFDAFFLLHGALFLSLRETGELVRRSRRVAEGAWLVNLLLLGLVVVCGYATTSVFKQVVLNPLAVPLDYLALGALAMLAWFNARGRSGWAFAMAFAVTLCSAAIVCLCLFPRLMISSLNPAWSLTIGNAATNAYALTVISWIGLTFIPFVILYQGWNYWVFRQRIQPHAGGHY